MKKATILHLSDLHLAYNEKNTKKKLIEKILEDCNNNFKSKIDLVLFTGDFVSDGKQETYNVAKEFIELIIRELNIEKSNFLYIPGNHEVNINQIKNYYFSGLMQENDKKKWDKYNYKADSDLCHQMKEYLDFEYSVDFKNDIAVNKIIEVNNLKIGLTLINTAWFSKGKTSDDRDKIFITGTKIKEQYNELKNVDFKICALHHPYSYFKYEFVSESEQELGNYDLVLGGHVHDNNFKIINNIPGNNAVFITGSEICKEDNNGYFIYNISKESNTCDIYMRKYYKKRDLYDKNEEIFENGFKRIEIGNVPHIDKILYKVYRTTKNKFLKNLDGLMITNVLETSLNKNFSNNFIMPKLSAIDEDNDYETNRREAKFEELLDDNYSKVLINGKKEVGKTIFAYYISKYYYDKFDEYKQIPVVLNCKNTNFNNKYSIIGKIKDILNEYVEDDESISRKNTEELLLNNKFVLLLDDFSRENNLEDLIKFIDEYKISKTYIFLDESLINIPYTETEAIIKKIKGKTKSISIYIEEFSKNQIRKYSMNLLGSSNKHVDELCSKTVNLFNEMSLPKTPFAVSLFISICTIDADFEPTNKSKIVEKLIEIMLEKLSPNDIYLKSYGFDSKCTFLASLAYDMYKNNKYYYTINEYMEFVINYHKNKMFSLDETKFDKLFFDRNILINKNNKIMFRFKCFIYYFLALYMSKKGDEIIEIARSEHYYNYEDLFEYYTGINKDSVNFIKIISEKYENLIEETPNLNELLNLNIIKDEILNGITVEKINNLKPLCEEEKDNITDIVSKPEYNPESIDSYEDKNKSEELFYAMNILGNAIRNCEDIDGSLKMKYLKLYMRGTLSVTSKIFYSFKDMIIELKNRIMKVSSNYKDKEAELEELFLKFADIVKITIPLLVQKFILESVGTRKLKNVLDEILKSNIENDFELLNYLCLYADLRIDGWDDKFINLIYNTENKLIELIIIEKCFDYARMNYFNDEMASSKKVLMKSYSKIGYKKKEINNSIDLEFNKLKLKNTN